MDTKEPKESFNTISIAPKPASSEGNEEMPPKRPRSGRRRKKSRTSKGLGVLGWLSILVVGCVALYFLGTVLLVPYLFRTWLPDHLSSQWKREVVVGAAAFDPFNGRLILERGSIGPASVSGSEVKGDEIITFTRMLVDLEAASILKGGIIAREIVFEDPVLRLARNEDATLNLASLFPSLVEGGKGIILSFISGKAQIFGLDYSLNNISIRNGLLTFADRVSQKTHEVRELNFSLPAIASLAYPMEAYQPPHFSAIINGSPMEIDGVAADNGELESQMHLKSDYIDLPAYFGYLPEGTVPKLKKGRGDCDLTLHISFASDTGMRLQIAGAVNMRDLEFTGENGERPPKIKLAEMVIRAEPLAGDYRIESLLVSGPEISLVREKEGALSLSGFQNTSFAGAGIEMKVATAVVEKGKIFFIDRSVNGGFKDTVNNVSLKFDLLADGEESYVAIAATGHSKTKASLSLKGRFDPAVSRFDGEFAVGSVPLASLKPYWDTLFAEQDELVVKKGQGMLSARLQVMRKGSKVTIEKGVAVLENLVITSKEQGIIVAPKVTIKGVEISPDKKQIELDSVASEGAQLFFFRDSEGDWRGPGVGNRPVVDKKVTAKKWAINVRRLVLTKSTATMHLADTASTKKTKLTPVKHEAKSVSLEYIALDEEPGKGRVTGKALLPGKGSFSFAGPVSEKPSFTADLDCTLTNLNLTVFNPQIASWFTPEVTSGILRAQGKLRLPEAKFSGLAGVSKFSSAVAKGKSRSKREFIQWHNALAENFEVDFKPFRMQVNTLSIDQPYFSWIGAGKEQINFTSFFPNRKFLEKSDNVVVGIKTIRIEKGILDYIEPGTPALSFSVTDIKGVVTGFETLATNRAKFSIDGQVEAKAPLSLVGTAGLFEKNMMLSMKSRLHGLKIAPFSQHIEPFLGWEVGDGELSMTSEYQRKDNQVEASNSLEVKGLTLGDRLKGGRPGLPLASALLTDENRIIRLQVPLAGSMQDSELTIRNKLGDKIRNVVGSATVSPFSMVHEVFAEGKSVEQVTFPFGSAQLNEGIVQDLQKVSGLIAKRPGLALILQGSADVVGDREAIMAERTRKAVKDVGAEIRQSAALTKRKNGSPPIRSAAPSTPTPVEDWELGELAEERSLRVAQYLVEELGIGAHRIVVREQMEIVPENTTGRTGNRVRFILGVIPK